MSRRQVYIAARCGLAVFLGACVWRCAPKAAPIPSTADRPGPVSVPPGCLEDLSGEYAHASAPAYRYRGSDDGGSLRLLVERPAGADGGVSSEADSTFILVERTPRGFVGATHARAFHPSGQVCAVTFPTEVVGCFDGGLSLKSARSASVDESCRPATHGGPEVMLEHQLLKALPADAGETAGNP